MANSVYLRTGYKIIVLNCWTVFWPLATKPFLVLDSYRFQTNAYHLRFPIPLELFVGSGDDHSTWQCRPKKSDMLKGTLRVFHKTPIGKTCTARFQKVKLEKCIFNAKYFKNRVESGSNEINARFFSFPKFRYTRLCTRPLWMSKLVGIQPMFTSLKQDWTYRVPYEFRLERMRFFRRKRPGGRTRQKKKKNKTPAIEADKS